ncbi:MAG: hypothetical protein Fur0020_02800 [Thermodesulfovibrionia bacterium]
MALEGFLQEFGLTDILQLIYFQKKTGVLRIEGKDNVINVSILNGNITGIESERRTEEGRLGRVLVKKGILSPEDLNTALELQKQENERLAYILYKKGLVSKDVLIETIQHQITDTIATIFTWEEGRYEFIPQEKVPEEIPIDIDTQHLLMDSLKMVDEWSVIEGELNFTSIFKQERMPEDGELNEMEAAVLNLIDGESDVSTIMSISSIGDLETAKAIISLRKKGVIAPVKRVVEEVVIPAVVKPVIKPIMILPIVLTVAIILLVVLIGQMDVFKAFKRTRAVSKIERLKNEIDIYKVTNGRYPEDLEVITDDKDPWGMPFIYTLTEDGFKLFSSGPDRVRGTGDDIY